jgi:hypothetical protein
MRRLATLRPLPGAAFCRPPHAGRAPAGAAPLELLVFVVGAASLGRR